MKALATISANFIRGTKGPLFLMVRQPPEPKGCVLVVPPFAEEMNKCRRLVTMVALGLQESGIATAVIDLYGTGDSGGEFGDAEWEAWERDLSLVCGACADMGLPVTGVLASRLGAAMAVSAAAPGILHQVSRTVFWQPVFDGTRFMHQFLRMRVAASLADHDRKESIADLRAALAAGGSVEVAGYRVSGRLSQQIEALHWPDSLPPGLGSICWIETVREEGVPMPPQATRLIERTRQAGIDVQVRLITGEPYWAATEIVESQDLVSTTVAAFTEY